MQIIRTGDDEPCLRQRRLQLLAADEHIAGDAPPAIGDRGEEAQADRPCRDRLLDLRHELRIRLAGRAARRKGFDPGEPNAAFILEDDVEIIRHARDLDARRARLVATGRRGAGREGARQSDGENRQ